MCLCNWAVSGVVRLGKSKHFTVLSAISVVGGTVYVFCATLSEETRVV